jgi:hypothetical protein
VAFDMTVCKKQDYNNNKIISFLFNETFEHLQMKISVEEQDVTRRFGFLHAKKIKPSRLNSIRNKPRHATSRFWSKREGMKVKTLVKNGSEGARKMNDKQTKN